MDNIQKKTSYALKWSSLAEIIAKLVLPLSNIISARILTPEAFGVVATVTMVISFADLFSDSGFQKYLVQHEFEDDTHLKIAADVAFTCNLMISIFLWGIISVFNVQLATLVGSPGLGMVIVVAGASLPLTSFSSIQAALLRRKFNYKALCYARIVSALLPLIITVPLALLGLSYWSIIICNIAGNLSNALILTIISEWKPMIEFRKNELIEMLSFSVWSLIESLGTWLSSYIDTLIVGGILTQYYLGLYKTTITTVNGIFGIITCATTTVLFSTLSRLQNEREEYDKAYLNFINIVSIIIIPIGVGIFMYKELVTKILLGTQWFETIPFVGIYGLMCCFTLVLGQYASEYFRGLGKPKANVLMTILHLVALIPVLILSSKQGFISLAYSRSIVKIEQILVYWGIMWFGFKFNLIKILKVISKSLFSAVVMAVVAYIMLRFFNNSVTQLVSIIVCVIVYFSVYIFICRGKREVVNMIKMFTGKA